MDFQEPQGFQESWVPLVSLEILVVMVQKENLDFQGSWGLAGLEVYQDQLEILAPQDFLDLSERRVPLGNRGPLASLDSTPAAAASATRW